MSQSTCLKQSPFPTPAIMDYCSSVCDLKQKNITIQTLQKQVLPFVRHCSFVLFFFLFFFLLKRLLCNFPGTSVTWQGTPSQSKSLRSREQGMSPSDTTSFLLVFLFPPKIVSNFKQGKIYLECLVYTHINVEHLLFILDARKEMEQKKYTERLQLFTPDFALLWGCRNHCQKESVVVRIHFYVFIS